MKEHVNFYENLKEANSRLRGSIVMYDGNPYYIMAIASHMKDGIFRAYLQEVSDVMRLQRPHFLGDVPPDHPLMGKMMDEWLETEEGKQSGVLRKMLNSPLFNKFRPFPLGMCNVGPDTWYVERQPNRKMEQGLIKPMLDQTKIGLALPRNSGPSGGMKVAPSNGVELFSLSFKACVLAEHPTGPMCLAALLDPSIENNSVAFHREFALVRGPIDSIFLAYKGDIVGILPKRNFSSVVLGEKFKHVREAVGDLRLFTSIE